MYIIHYGVYTFKGILLIKNMVLIWFFNNAARM